MKQIREKRQRRVSIDQELVIELASISGMPEFMCRNILAWRVAHGCPLEGIKVVAVGAA